MAKQETIVMYGKQYVTLGKAAEKTGYSPSYICKLTKQINPKTGKPVIERVQRGKTHVYNLVDLEKYIYGNSSATTGDQCASVEDVEI